MEKPFLSIDLSEDQALVLFDWLALREEARSESDPIDAETQVLWNIEGQLERVLIQPFDPNYTTLVQRARQRILSENED
jgi:hypothetical protein